MSVSVEELSPIRKKLVIEVAADQVTEKIEQAYAKIAKTADLKGFRKGKVPRAMLEKHYAPRMEQDVAGSLINETLYRALLDNEIVAVAQPEVVESGQVEKGKAFTYLAEVEVKPEIVVKDYTGIELDREILQFNDESVQQRLEEMAASRAQLEVSSRKKTREGDTVIIDFEGFIDDTPFENGAAKDYQLELGSNSFIPGFEEQLIGLKREDEKSVEVSFPENYGSKELAGKPATFKVLVKEIKEKVEPKLNKDFAGEFGCETIDELRDKLKDDMVKQETARIDNQVQEALMNALVENNPMEVPDGMVQNQLLHLKDSFTSRLKAQGMSLEMLGMNDETFSSTYYPMAEQQVKGELILEAIAKRESITTEDSEIDEKIKQIAEEANAPLDNVQEYFKKPEMRQGLEHQVQHDKVISFLIDQSVVTEVEPKQEDAAEKES
ncbi:MAG: trigger factor [Desulfuromonas sp.]|jgi:trigger factor|nr:MAG: trigger factor [Desulfuromonas sp.]